MKRKKFSQFDFPKNPSEIYLVGYEVGTGENGDNTSVQIKASDLAFSVSGSAGVSSVNGIAGSVFINAGDGVSLTQTGNGITISAKNELKIDKNFDSESDNPQSGVAISNELSKYANLEDGNIFHGEQQIDKLNIVGKLRVNAPTAFNDEVTVNGKNVSESLVNASAHIASSDLHLTSEKSAIIALADSHIENESAHVTSTEKETWNTVNQKADKADFSGVTQPTVEIEPTSTGEFDAIRLGTDTAPHDFGIKKVTLYPKNTNTTPLYLAIFKGTGNNKSFISISENALAWSAGDTCTWTFQTPVLIDADKGLELFLVTGADAINSNGSVTAPGVLMMTAVQNSGSGAVRYHNQWYSGRNVYVEFSSSAHVGDKSHLSATERNSLEALLARVDDILALLQ